MKKEKLYRKDVGFFLLPLLVLTIFFGSLTFLSVKNRIEDIHAMREDASLNIADSYTSAVIKYKEAYNIAMNLLEEKILVASRAVLLIDENGSTVDSLKNLAQELQVDQINLYDVHGEILVSNIEAYVGWTAYEGHPAKTFMDSSLESFIENIRLDSESGEPYLFGYMRKDEETFVQIGVLDENVNYFTNRFEYQRLVEDIVDGQELEQALFIDPHHKVVASSKTAHLNLIFTEPTLLRDLEERAIIMGDRTYEALEGFHVMTPVFFEGSYEGTLILIWPENMVAVEVKNVVLRGMLEFGIILSIVSGILYYAFKKNKSNVKIAYYDDLTGLPNKTYLEEYLEKEMLHEDTKKKAVLLLNCTNFKTLNMTYGYKYGDRILKEIAKKVKGVLGKEMMFFRFNADRFVVVLEEYQNKNQLTRLANELVTIFRHPLNGGTKHEYMEVQVAILEINATHDSSDKILQDASLALSHLKQPQKHQVISYETFMQEEMHRKEQIEETLRKVISGEDGLSFALHFQPLWGLKAQRVSGFEALARLQVPRIGSVAPMEFIALAESNLMIYELGLVILRQACAFLHEVPKEQRSGIKIAVNISLIQLLRDEFAEDVRRILREQGISGSNLEFEITESMLEENFTLLNERLMQLKKLGICIALDDFGTGFSSFARLRALNIDTVKIDKYFVDRICETEEEELITADVISMAHKINLTVVAEGVEEESQMIYLEKYHCDILQGYYISKPLEKEKALVFLLQDERWHAHKAVES